MSDETVVADQPAVTDDVRMVPISLIHESEVALRGVERNSEKYLQLVDSIAKRGILNSILVREATDPATGRMIYGLVDGLQRFSAAKDAGLSEVPARITSMSDGDLLEAQIIANIHKIETKPVQYTKQLVRIMSANPMLTLRELASKLSQSVPWLTDRLNLVKLDEKIQKLVDEGQIRLTNAYALAKLPVEEQPEWVDRAMTDGPSEFLPAVHSRVNDIKAAKRKGTDTKKVEFSPTPFMRKLGEIKDEFNDFSMMDHVLSVEEAETPSDGWKACVKWLLHMDTEGVNAQKAKYDERQAKLQAEKERRASEREKKKQEDAAKKAADVQSL